VLKDSQKIVVDPQVKGLQAYLPLSELGRTRTPPVLLSTPQPGAK